MKIRDLSHVWAGYLSRSRIDPDPDGSHFLLQIRDFNDSRRSIDKAGMVRFSAGSVKKRALLKDGDVVFLSKGSRNFAAAVRGLPTPSLAASYFFVLRPNPEVLGSYLAWFLNQGAARQHFFRLATTGAHMPIVRRDVLENLEIPLPELPTQKRIVATDELAYLQQCLLAELAEKKQMLAKVACLRAAHRIIIDPDQS